MTSRRLPAPAAFVAAVVSFFTMMAAAGAPSPLLVLYQQQWGFPAWQLTVAFSIYALTLLLTLLTVGALSDFVGRKPMMLSALVVQVVAMALFLASTDIGMIISARAVQGVATGIATSTFSAYISEIAPPRLKSTGALLVSIAPLGGLGIGAILTGVAVQLTSAPAPLVFTVALAVFSTALVALIFAPETVSREPGAVAAMVPRLRVPAAARRSFMAVTPGLIGIWMAAGLMLGLSASIAHDEFHLRGGLINGLLVALQPLTATLATVVIGPLLSSRKLVPLGYMCVLVGVTLEAGSLWLASFPLILIGAAIAGIGFGCAFSGALGTLTPIAAAHERAELFSAIYLVGYLAYGIPTILIGVLIGKVGLSAGTLTYSAAILIATLYALIAFLVDGRRRVQTRIRPLPESQSQTSAGKQGASAGTEAAGRRMSTGEAHE
ncbi:MFS transporter [Streptomyces sp. NPDC058459]|uniref:MFS transporter n=1 Tax=Streptomyces sp. NPDC058459 TaxID=3346508 RepID=UPI0036624C67